MVNCMLVCGGSKQPVALTFIMILVLALGHQLAYGVFQQEDYQIQNLTIPNVSKSRGNLDGLRLDLCVIDRGGQAEVEWRDKVSVTKSA